MKTASSVEQGQGEEEAKEENNMKAKVEEEQYKTVDAEEFCTRQNVNPVPEQ